MLGLSPSNGEDLSWLLLPWPARSARPKRIFERLKEEHGFAGAYTIVKDYVRSAELRSREMFVPLTHAPGEAQAVGATEFRCG